MPTPAEIRAAAAVYLAAKEAARAAVNEANRSQTELRKMLVQHLADVSLPVDSVVELVGVDVQYTVAESEMIPPSDWLKMYESGELTREQFLDCLSVSKGDAKTVVGEDVVLRIAKKTKGTKADLRITEIPSARPVGHFKVRPTVVALPPSRIAPTIKPLARKIMVRPLNRIAR